MSWSVSKIGKSDALLPALEQEFAKITWLGEGSDESKIKDSVGKLVAEIIAAQTRKDCLVKVDCSGSASTHPADGNSHTVQMSVTTLWGVVS